MKQRNIYIDNERFYNEICEYRKKYIECEVNKKPRPVMSNYIGECFLKIANNFSNKPNFIGYSYKDEMIGDSIEICVRFAHKFDPDKSKNPFAYFTQVVFFSFIQRIAKEKRQQEMKYKILEDCEMDFVEDEEGEMKQYILENMRKLADDKIIDKIIKKEVIRKPKKISNFNMFE